MTVCASRSEACGFFTPCAPCQCGDAVREELRKATREPTPNTVLRGLLVTRTVRVPDSAREA